MANLSFLSTLTEQQRQYAEIIRERAQAMGIPPDLAVAVAFQESRLNPASPTSPKGAMGIMQVRPIAARDVGVDPEKLQDPDTNIDAGLRYLKKALTETGDPRLAVIYYNAGPQRLIEFDRGGDLPKETQDYLMALKGYGAFRAEPPAEPASEPSLNLPEPPSAPVLNRSEPVLNQPEPPQEDPYKLPDMQKAINAQERRMAELVGLGGGTAVAGLRARADMKAAGSAAAAPGQGVGLGAFPAGPGGASTVAPPVAVAPAGPTGAPGGPSIPAAAPAGGPVGGSAGPASGPAGAAAQAVRVRQGTPGDAGTTGVQRMRFNEQTAQQAARTKAASSMFDELMRRGVVPANASQVLAGMPDLSATQSGILVPQSTMMESQAPRPPQSPLERTAQAQEAQRRARMTQTLAGVGRTGSPPLPPAVTPPAPIQGALPTPPAPKPGGLEQVTQAFRRMAETGLGLAGRAMRYVAPPLAGAQGAGELASAYQESRKEEPDPVTMALRTAGGLGALASAFPATAPVGLPVAIGAPLVQSMRERMAAQGPGDTSPLTEAEREMASRPAVFYRTGTRWPAAVLEQRRQAR